MTYKIISDEQELLIESNSREEVENKFLDYIRYTQQEWINMGDKTEEEVDTLIKDYKWLITSNTQNFNSVLIDYGFEELIIKG
jgi:hypothetical protein